MNDTIIKANSLEDAVLQGKNHFNVENEDLEIVVISEPKKNIFGGIKEQGEYKAINNKKYSRVDNAKDYLGTILKEMEIENFSFEVEEKEFETVIDISCEDSGAIIGRRGETIDSLQYLVSLASAKASQQDKRIRLDCSGYRVKRENTLKDLATRTAKSVLRTGYTSTLEPMNPYERRIIHAVISEMSDVESKSIGVEPFRKIQIISKNGKKDFKKPQKPFSKPKKSDDEVATVNIANISKTSFEQEYKKSTKAEQEQTAKLYEKLF